MPDGHRSSAKQALRRAGGVAGVAIAVMSAIPADAIQQQSAAKPEYNIEIVSTVRSKNVFITIDDGWFPNKRVLNLIKKEKIPTTTFLIGDALKGHERFWKEYSRYGSIQNHTLSHPFLTRIGKKEAIYEITEDQKVISSVIGNIPYMMRPPYGAYNNKVANDVASSGIKYVVLWSAEVPMGKDGYRNEPFKIETFDGKGLRPGEIILMHWDPGLYHAFKSLLEIIRKDGLKSGDLEKYLRK